MNELKRFLSTLIDLMLALVLAAWALMPWFLGLTALVMWIVGIHGVGTVFWLAVLWLVCQIPVHIDWLRSPPAWRT